MRHVRGLRGDLAAMLVLIGLVGLFFARVLSLRYHIPYDLNGYYYPLFSLVSEALHAGTLPLWDPYLYTGLPLVGNPQAQLFYPPTVLFLLLVGQHPLPYRQVEYLVIGHYAIAAASTYLTLRHGFTLTRFAATLGSAVYLFGGFLGSFTGHLGIVGGAAWLPLVVWGAKRTAERLSWPAAIGTGVALALVILTGFPPFALMVATALALGAAWVAGLALSRRDVRGALARVGLLALIVAVAAGLAAVQLCPFLDVLRQSVATDRPVALAMYGLQRESYLTLLLPHASGIGAGVVLGTDGFPLQYLYLGVLPLVLAALGFRAGHATDRQLLAGLLLLGLLWMVGGHLFVGRALTELTPAVIGRGYYAFLAMALFALAVAILAALGADALVRGAVEPSIRVARRVLAMGVAVALALALGFQFLLYWRPAAEPNPPLRVIEALYAFAIVAGLAWAGLRWIGGTPVDRRGALGWGMVGLVVLDLFSFGAGQSFNAARGSPDSVLSPGTLHGQATLIDWLQRDPDLGRGRFFRIDAHTRDGLWYLAPRLWRLESANGDDPLLPAGYQRLRRVFSTAEDSVARWGQHRGFSLRDPDSPLVDLLGIRYLIADASLSPEVRRRVEQRFDLVGVLDGYHVYRNPTPIPRAIVVRRAVDVPGPDALQAYLASPRFVPREHIVITARDAEALPPSLRGRGIGSTGDAPGEAAVSARSPRTLTIRARLREAGILHVSEAHAPGWRVRVDGQERAIIPANGVFRAVALEPGEHEVVFRYTPASLAVGVVGSVLGALGVAGALAAICLRRRGGR